MTSTLDLTRTPQPLSVGMSVLCPDFECGQSAEVIAAWVWSSTDGPVPHARTRCRAGHVFTPPSDGLVPIDA